MAKVHITRHDGSCDQSCFEGTQTLASGSFSKPLKRGDFCVGDRDAALQLAAKGKEHAQLAKEARQAANQAAFQSFNLHVTNRFKVWLINTHSCLQTSYAHCSLCQHLMLTSPSGC